MNPDEILRADKSEEHKDDTGIGTIGAQEMPSNLDAEENVPPAEPVGKSIGWAERLRQSLRRSAQGEARTDIKRQQLREDRTKAFVLLAGSTVILGLIFFALFSSPRSNHKSETARRIQPNLGRGPSAASVDSGRSITPLLSADTRNSGDESGRLSPQDIQNTAREKTFAESGNPTLPAAPPPTRDYALNRIQFPAEPGSAAIPPVSAVSKVDKLTKASLVFVSADSDGGAHGRLAPSGGVPKAPVETPFSLLPPGTRLVARLQTPVSTAIKAPVVAAIEYNYERDGEIVIPAGSKAFGELDQANDRGYVGLRFNSIQFPDGTTETIDGRSMGLNYQPLEGTVSGRNTGKKFLVRSLTGIGTILAATVGVEGVGVNDAISNNALIRERLADNVALAGEQQLDEMAYRQNIVVTVAGNTRFYIVLGTPEDRATTGSPGNARLSPNSTPATPLPSVQELRELMELKQELTQMYLQQSKMQTAQETPNQQ